jgi:chromatin segregation and condensation protein Rec8/ScpA/Scc1 (kleisin family)
LRQRAQQRHRTRQKIESLHRTKISILGNIAALRAWLQAISPEKRIAAEVLLAEAEIRPFQQAVFLALLHLAQSQEVKLEQTPEAEEFRVICGPFDQIPSEDDPSNKFAAL